MTKSQGSINPITGEVNLTERGVRIFNSRIKIQGPDECWPWLGGKSPDGYGKFSISRTQRGAHRITWMRRHGTIPDGLCVLHKCDHPACQNLKHLFLGTREVNNHDRDLKGRSNKGEECWLAKLTEREVIEIRRRYSLGVETQESIGKDFDVSGAQISMIVNRKSWSHVK